jgi:tryptophan halogenase
LKKIVVVGGGAAGWLTALYAKKIYLDAEVTLIESDEIGILGAGESSTPHLIQLLEYLEVPITDVIKACKATIKTSLKMVDWSSKGTFHHPFVTYQGVTNDSNWKRKSYFDEEVFNFAHLSAPLLGHELKDYSTLEKTAESFKVPFIENLETKNFETYSSYSLHFNASLFAAFLKSIGVPRGVIRKEGIVTEIITDDLNYITALKTDKEVIEADFVFDCTGFKRLIVGNFYQSKWKSHTDNLPAKKAVPFFLEPDGILPTHTEAKAMKYGWMWKAPLQDRYGCGYVFDSDYISDEEAIQEIETYLGYEPLYPRQQKGAFKFSAGCYETIWVKNALAVGLSAGFLEPMEGTSIMQTIITLRRFMSDKSNINSRNAKVIEKYNNHYLRETNELVSGVYLHYLSDRADTPFWKEFRIKNKTPEKVEYLLEVVKEKALSNAFDFQECSVLNDWHCNWLLLGNGLIDRDVLVNLGKRYNIEERQKEYLRLLAEDDARIAQSIGHKEFLIKLNAH